ncbi:hypothetical protein QJQ45_001328 [Haematococcus lacustris]|nr:hypothetical protein QJQ45_001328 [Haematococcus lacustris]
MPGAAVVEHGSIATDIVVSRVSIEPRRSSRHAAIKIAQTVPPPACLKAQAITPAAPDAADTPQTSVEGIPAAEEVALISDESSPGAPAAQAAAGGATVATRRSGRSRQHGAHPGGRVISPVERLRNAGTGRKTTGNNIRAQPPQSIRKEENEEGEEKEEDQEQQPGAAEAETAAGPGQQRPRWQQPTAVKACGEAVKKAGKRAGGGAGKEAGTALAASEASGASDTSELSSFERQRAALIARNNAMLAALALPQLAVAVNGLVSPAAASGVKGLRKRSRAADANPTESGSDADTTRVRRSSARVRGQAADPMLAAGIASESARGGIVLQASSHEHSIWGLSGGIVSAGKKAGKSVGPAQTSEPDVRQPTGPLAFTSDNASAAADEAVLRWLTVVQDAVTHLAWHPAADRLLLAAGEKSGQVALWKPPSACGALTRPDQVDDTPLPGGPEGFDGVLTFTHVHRKYISGLKWLSRGGSGAAAAHLVTASYDGSVRLLDVEQVEGGGVGPVGQAEGGQVDGAGSISALEVEEAGFVAYVGDSEGSIQVVDTRAAAAKLPQGLNLNKRINTLSLEPGCQQLLAAACSSGSVAVWDVRRLNQAGQGTGAGGSAGRGEPLCLVQHPNSCQSAYWAPDGSKVGGRASLGGEGGGGQGREGKGHTTATMLSWAAAAAAAVAVTAAAAAAAAAAAGYSSGEVYRSATPDSPALSLTQAQVLPHDNQTGRWLVPFRAVWGPAADCVAVGSMSRGVDLFTPDCAYKVGSLVEGELMRSIVSRLAFHPHCHALAAANGSGRLHVWR